MKKGITFIEILLVMVVLAIVTVGLIMTINPILQVNKGKDARRKKDLARIKVAFEEYYNDKMCYPRQDFIDGLDCNSRDFAPYLNTWPCDPDGVKYQIFIDDENQCPRYYRVYGKLQWKDDVQALNCDYGVSSSNVDWKDFPDEYETECGVVVEEDVIPTSIPACCDLTDCHTLPGGGSCNSANSCSGGECYYSAINCPGSGGNPCLDICKTDSCGQ